MSDFPKAILIDLDDTIIDDTGCVEACWADACVQAATRLDGLESRALRDAIREQADWFWSDPTRHRDGRLGLRAATRQIVERAFRHIGRIDIALAHATSDHYRALRDERMCLIPSALGALDTLRAAGVRLGLMTNGTGSTQRDKIKRFGLAPYFQHMVIEGEFGVGKPDRRVFETLLRELNVGPAGAWAIGDNLEFDVLAPMRLGLHGIWVDAAGKGCDGRPDQPDRIVSALSDLVAR
ncbi:MAG: HAD family hydrolase [Dehalococcoidia bacterium]